MAHRTPRLGMLHHALAAAMLLAPACAAPVEGDESEDFGEGESLVETSEYEDELGLTDKAADVGTVTNANTTAVWDSNGQGVRIARPSTAKTGDLLVLFLHRTDDVLPLNVSGWKRDAECFKRDNGYQCTTASSCSGRESGYCSADLAQVVFHKTVRDGEPSSYTFNMNKDSSGHPGWAILTVVKGANTDNPVRDWANTGCDNMEDSLFPSVRGEVGDQLLLSQSFDDRVAMSKFNPPDNTSTYAWVSNSDEAGFLFGRRLSSSGSTGTMKTHGEGASSCKDALISLTIRPR